MDVIREIRTIYDNYPDFSTDILAASIRTVNHVKEAAMIGADVATVPPAILKALVKHPLTDAGFDGVRQRLEEDRAEDRVTSSPQFAVGKSRALEEHPRRFD